MSSINLSSYSPNELQDALRVLRSFVTASKQIGERAKLIDPKNPEDPKLRVEYSPLASLEFVREFSKNILTEYFPESQDFPCEFVSNDRIS